MEMVLMILLKTQNCRICSFQKKITLCFSLVCLLSYVSLAAKLPETLSLINTKVQGCAAGENTIYAIFSNAIWRCAYNSKNWSKQSNLPFKDKDEVIKSIKTLWTRPQFIYLLSSKRLYLSGDGGASFSSKLLTYTTRANNDVVVFPDNINKILIATSDGVWISYDSGQSFDRFFQRINKKENFVNTIAIDSSGNQIFVATKACLFISQDKGNTFKKIVGLPKVPITHIATSPFQVNSIAFIADNRLFYSDSSLKTFVLVSDIYDFGSCQEIIIAGNGKDIIWSYPGGIIWGKDWLSSVADKNITKIPNAAMGNLNSNQLAVIQTQKVVKTTFDKNVLTNKEQQLKEKKYKEVMKKIRREPSAKEVLQAAFDYAKLNPERIKKWLDNVHKSAWLPELRILGGSEFGGYDQYGREGSPADANPNVAPLQLYRQSEHNDNASFRAEAELSWKFGKVLFDPNEVFIDQQLNRQTELREDIANTVTIYYYQRRNLLFNKLFNPPKDFAERSRLEFQIEEITTKLDTLSGGFFSKRLKQINKQDLNSH